MPLELSRAALLERRSIAGKPVGMLASSPAGAVFHTKLKRGGWPRDRRTHG
jgi:hypothetical protein